MADMIAYGLRLLSYDAPDKTEEVLRSVRSDQTNCWCLFGVYYWRVLERIKRIWLIKEKRSKV
jgi:hypothetical protein